MKGPCKKLNSPMFLDLPVVIEELLLSYKVNHIWFLLHLPSFYFLNLAMTTMSLIYNMHSVVTSDDNIVPHLQISKHF